MNLLISFKVTQELEVKNLIKKWIPFVKVREPFTLDKVLLWKPYNLTYFIRLFAVATFTGYKISHFNRKPYKTFYMGGFIRKSIKDNVPQKSLKN